MRIRPYIESRDYEYIEKWIDSEKIHAFLERLRLNGQTVRMQQQKLMEKS